MLLIYVFFFRTLWVIRFLVCLLCTTTTLRYTTRHDTTRHNRGAPPVRRRRPIGLDWVGFRHHPLIIFDRAALNSTGQASSESTSPPPRGVVWWCCVPFTPRLRRTQMFPTLCYFALRTTGPLLHTLHYSTLRAGAPVRWPLHCCKRTLFCEPIPRTLR